MSALLQHLLDGVFAPWAKIRTRRVRRWISTSPSPCARRSRPPPRGSGWFCQCAMRAGRFPPNASVAASWARGSTSSTTAFHQGELSRLLRSKRGSSPGATGTEGIIDKTDFEPKLQQLKNRLERIDQQVNESRQHGPCKMSCFSLLPRLRTLQMPLSKSWTQLILQRSAGSCWV